MFGCILPIFYDPIKHKGDVSPESWDMFYVHFIHEDSGVGKFFFLFYSKMRLFII